jgi:hypothetical protein
MGFALRVYRQRPQRAVVEWAHHVASAGATAVTPTHAARVLPIGWAITPYSHHVRTRTPRTRPALPPVLRTLQG